MTSQNLTVPLTALRRHPANRTPTVDSVKAIAQSITANGLLSPIAVRAHPTEAGCFEVLAGETRWKAAEALGWKVITAVIHERDDAEAVAYVALENLHRANLTPWEESALYAQWLQQPGANVESIASRAGHSVTVIRRRLQLVHLNEDAAKMLAAGDLPLGHAEEIARLPWTSQVDVTEWLGAQLSFRVPDLEEVQRWIAINCLHVLKSAPFDVKDATLVPSAGPCGACPKRSGAQPELFADLGKKDTCTDVACWQDKEKVFVARRWEEAVAEGPCERVSNDFRSDSRDTLLRGSWFEVEEGTKKARRGLIVGGERIGELVWFTTTRPSAVDAPDDEARALARKLREERQRELTFRGALFGSIRRQVEIEPEFDDADIRELAQAIIDRLDDDSAKRFCQSYGLVEGKTRPAPGYRGVMEARLKTLKAGSLRAFVLMLPHAGDLGAHGPDRMSATAKRLGIDLKAVRKEAAKVAKAS